MKKIAVATTGRADWGLLSPLVRSLQESGRAEVSILAGGTHFSEQLGMTCREIEADGFSFIRVDDADEAKTECKFAALSLEGYGRELAILNPDCLVLLGDRYEMLAVALAASVLRIPIVHIAGGAISEGAFDDCFRHAITKLATLHLTETEAYRRRIIQMGEEPERVLTTGAIGLHILTHERNTLLTKSELEESLNFCLDKPFVVATLHAATLDVRPAEEQMSNFLTALDNTPSLKVIITYPNADTDPTPLIRMIEDFARRNPERVRAIPSLGRRRYISALQFASAVAGNSSSGIVEVPSMGIPTLDVGIRQRGRVAARSVVHCGGRAPEIEAGLRKVLSPEIRKLAALRENPYYQPDTLQLMTDAILTYNFRHGSPKKFHDL